MNFSRIVPRFPINDLLDGNRASGLIGANLSVAAKARALTIYRRGSGSRSEGPITHSRVLFNYSILTPREISYQLRSLPAARDILLELDSLTGVQDTGERYASYLRNYMKHG